MWIKYSYYYKISLSFELRLLSTPGWLDVRAVSYGAFNVRRIFRCSWSILPPHPSTPTTHDPRARRTAWSVAADYMPGPYEAPSFGKTERGKNKRRNKKWRMSFDTKEVGDGRENWRAVTEIKCSFLLPFVKMWQCLEVSQTETVALTACHWAPCVSSICQEMSSKVDMLDWVRPDVQNTFSTN